MSGDRALARDDDVLARERAAARIPIAPSMGPALEIVSAPVQRSMGESHVVWVSALAVALGIASGGIARRLSALVAVITNLAFYGRWSTIAVGTADNRLGRRSRRRPRHAPRSDGVRHDVSRGVRSPSSRVEVRPVAILVVG